MDSRAINGDITALRLSRGHLKSPPLEILASAFDRRSVTFRSAKVRKTTAWYASRRKRKYTDFDLDEYVLLRHEETGYKLENV